MDNHHFITAISILLVSSFPSILSQQPYIRQNIEECNSRDTTTSVLGYTCNGAARRCQSYLTFRAQPPYESLSSISSLLDVNPSELAQLNSLPENATLELNRMLLVPATCSCSGDQYQANTSYVVRQDDTYFAIANLTFQGLTTCQALQVWNPNVPVLGLFPGTRLSVPLRCACPTENQTSEGVSYLLSYLITWNQMVSTISASFGVGTAPTLAANSLSEADPNIYPFTTLLIPLRNPPNASQVSVSQPPLPQPPPPAPPRTGGGGPSKTWIYAVVGVVGGLLLVGGILFCVFFRKQKKPEASGSFESVEKPLEKEVNDDSNIQESISSIAQSLKVYSFKEVKSATNYFSSASLIKGSVYLGTLSGDLAAIKVITGDVSKEISLLNKINHFNLIRLSGVCFNEGNWYLVYEYASNGSLSDWIQNKTDLIVLSWNRRLQIGLDIAAGLNYLHRYTSPPHIHKDLNSGNVLLDGDLRAKIANFGLARSAEGEFALTRHIVGTQGYMAPEYLENGVVSTKLDVYAFGVVMLEILTGKQVSLLSDQGVIKELAEVLVAEDVGNLMDPVLEGRYPGDISLTLFRMIGNCLKKDPSERPDMDDIFQTLSTSMLSAEWAVSITDLRTVPR